MPPLIPKGPDLPVELLEAQAGGELVVFAGAGVSNPAGLPTFRCLVEKVYDELNETFSDAEKTLSKRGEYDRVLGLLEERVGAHMRTKVREILKTPTAANTDVHRALLDISRDGDKFRLVTTNFDRLFLEAGVGPPQLAQAPRLPVPRRTHWQGLVHLHGLIEDEEPEGQNLVLTSADFGRAYLLDRWASRFVSELFQNFHVLFVGYGVNDPVMRYLLDSLAAERKRGEDRFRAAFALAGLQGRKAKRDRLRAEWEAKGVEPVFYEAGWKHRKLALTLTRWAELCRGGLRTRRAWALRQAEQPPSNPYEDEARFVVWALSEPSGAVARAWAEKEPAPAIGWLEVFEKSGELPEKKELLALPPNPEQSQAYGVHPERLPIADQGGLTTQPRGLSRVTGQLARWLVRHLDKKELMAWVLRSGGVLHPMFRLEVREQLKKDDGILSAPFRKVWDLLASEEYSARKSGDANAPDTGALLKLASQSTVARLEVVRLLRPVPLLTARRSNDLKSVLARQAGMRDPLANPKEVSDLVNVGLALAGGHAADLLLRSSAPPSSDMSLPRLFPQISVGLLEEALEWLAYFDRADSETDDSHVFMPSIAPHAQNRHFDGWTLLVDLNRRVFEMLDETTPKRARELVERWREVQFPIFRRLVLHAATDGKSVETDLGVRLLLERQRRMLWSVDERRECLRFLRVAGSRLPAETREELSAAILEGPPRDLYIPNLSEERFEEIREEAIWRRLVRLEMSGAALSSEAELFLRRARPEKDWRVPEDHQDEFPFWIGDLTSVEPPGDQGWRIAAQQQPVAILEKLAQDAGEDQWNQDIWAAAIQEFGTPVYDQEAGRERFAQVASLLCQAPREFLERNTHMLASWLLEQSGQLPVSHEAQFLRIWEDLATVALPETADLDGDPVFRALNHPAGQLADALLRRLWGRELKPDDGVPQDLVGPLGQMVQGRASAAALARVVLASNLMSLFLLDRRWVEEFLLPRFSWSDEAEAARMWSGYFWMPRFNPDLVAAYKNNFLEAFDHLDKLGPGRQNAARLLVFISVDNPRAFSRQEIGAVLGNLEADYLANAASALSRLLEENERPEDLWHETLELWVKIHWPVSGSAVHSSEVSTALGEMTLRTGRAFPEAIKLMSSYLSPVEGPGYRLVGRPEYRELARDFPDAMLGFLDRVVPREARPGHWSELRGVLDDLGGARPSLEPDPRYKRLDALLLAGGW